MTGHFFFDPTVFAFLNPTGPEQARPGTQAIVVRNAPMLGYRTTEGAWYLQDDFVASTGIKLIVLTLNFRQEYPLHGIYKPSLPLL